MEWNLLSLNSYSLVCLLELSTVYHPFYRIAFQLLDDSFQSHSKLFPSPSSQFLLSFPNVTWLPELSPSCLPSQDRPQFLMVLFKCSSEDWWQNLLKSSLPVGNMAGACLFLPSLQQQHPAAGRDKMLCTWSRFTSCPPAKGFSCRQSRLSRSGGPIIHPA